MSARDHQLEPINIADYNFFAPAPPEIGEVTSQFSTLKAGETGSIQAVSIKRNIIFLAMLVAGIILYVIFKSTLSIAFVLLGGGFFMLGLLATKANYCTYVGTKGFAKYPFKKGNPTPVNSPQNLFLFESANEFYTNVIDVKGHLYFFGQNAIYAWQKDFLKVVFSNFTTDFDPLQVGAPKESNMTFLRRCEQAWTEYLVPELRAKLQAFGEVKFPLKNQGAITLTPQAITIDFKGQVTQILKGDLLQIEHTAGELEFVTPGGRTKLEAFKVANILALEALVMELYGFVQTDAGIALPEK